MKLLLVGLVVTLVCPTAKAGFVPDGVNASFMCSTAELAFSFAKKLTPDQNLDAVFEALQLGPLCGVESPKRSGRAGFDAKSRKKQRRPFSPDSVCVNSIEGDDASSGSCPDDPVRTLKEAIGRGKGTIYLMPNAPHHLDETIRLDSSHSGLTITGWGDDDYAEPPVVSGLTPLGNLEWMKSGEDDNIWVAKLDLEGGVPGLHYKSPSGEKKRGVLARFPNTANPFIMNEEFSGDQRILEDVATFLPPKNYDDGDFDYLYIDEPKRDDTPDGWFQHFQAGIGGSCEIYDPPVSYWCSNATQGGGAFQYKVPSGVKLDSSFLPNLPKYTKRGVKDAIVNAWRPYRWENWMFTGDIDLSTGIFTFTGGGFQGARGDEKGGDWFIENVKEELDFADEIWYDREEGKLYLYLNSTEASHPDELGDFGVPGVDCLFNLTGESAASPVKDVTISGVAITGTAPTFLTAPHTGESRPGRSEAKT
jgi:hypothetical protein